jgi:hypothetical protein
MILDMLSSFCFERTFATTGYSTDATANAGLDDAGYVDLGETDAFAADSDTGTMSLGLGTPLTLEALVTTLMNDAATPRAITCIVSLETADDSGFTSNLTTILTLPTFAAGSEAGTKVSAFLPLGNVYRRYLRVKFTVSGTLTGGKFSAYLCKDAQNNVNYPSRITVA